MYYSTRARTFAESLRIESRPRGYDDFATRVMIGDLCCAEDVYALRLIDPTTL